MSLIPCVRLSRNNGNQEGIAQLVSDIYELEDIILKKKGNKPDKTTSETKHH